MRQLGSKMRRLSAPFLARNSIDAVRLPMGYTGCAQLPLTEANPTKLRGNDFFPSLFVQ